MGRRRTQERLRRRRRPLSCAGRRNALPRPGSGTSSRPSAPGSRRRRRRTGWLPSSSGSRNGRRQPRPASSSGGRLPSAGSGRLGRRTGAAGRWSGEWRKPKFIPRLCRPRSPRSSGCSPTAAATWPRQPPRRGRLQRPWRGGVRGGGPAGTGHLGVPGGPATARARHGTVPECRELLVEYELPRQDVIPAVTGYRYAKAEDIVPARAAQEARDQQAV